MTEGLVLPFPPDDGGGEVVDAQQADDGPGGVGADHRVGAQRLRAVRTHPTDGPVDVLRRALTRTDPV